MNKHGLRRLMLFGIAVAFVFTLFAVSAPRAAAWYDMNWDYRVEIQIDPDMVENENFNNFPTLIEITLDDSHVGYENGQDILFVDNDNNKIPHEIENYDNLSGSLITWVRIPTLYDNENTVIYCYYGNASAPLQENVENVWDDNYAGVWHLSELGTGTRYDSTSNNKDGTTSGYDGDESTSGGKIDGTDNLDGTNDFVAVGNVIASTDIFTISAWINTYTYSPTGTNPGIVADDDWSAGKVAFSVIAHDASNLKLQVNVNGGLSSVDSAKVNFKIATWYYVVWAYENLKGSESSKLYVDDLLDSDTTTGTFRTVVLDKLNIGDFLGARFIQGTIDEVRISNIIRNANYLRTSFFIENDPTGAITSGSEESSPATLVVSTTSSENIAPENAGLIGNLDTLGETWADCFFQFRVNGTASWDNNDYDNVRLTGVGAYGITLDNNGVGLISNTLYDYRAYAIDDTGDNTYGSTLTFTTENWVQITDITVTNSLVDRDNDFVGSSPTLTTTLQITVWAFGDNGLIVVDNVDIFIYDNTENIAVDNATPDSSTATGENTRRFDYSYNPADNLTNDNLGTFDIRIYATVDGQVVDNWDNDQFTVDDLDNTDLVNQENLAGHRHRVYGTSTTVTGGTVVLASGTRVDNNDGSVAAEVSGTSFENTYTPSASGTVYFNLETADLDGRTVALTYDLPDIRTEVISFTVDNVVIDRDHDDASSTVKLSTVVTVQIRDNDNRDDIISAWFFARDNLDVVRDNENVYNTATVIDENTYSFTFSINPDDDLPDNGLGYWDVWVNNFEHTFSDFETDPTVDMGTWTYEELDTNDVFSPALYGGWVKSGTYSWLVDSSGSCEVGDYAKYIENVDLTFRDNFAVWIRGYHSNNKISVSVGGIEKWSKNDYTNSVVESLVTVNTIGSVGFHEIEIKIERESTTGDINLIVDNLRFASVVDNGMGENQFIVSDLTTDATFDPVNPYYRWAMYAYGRVSFMDNDNYAICENIWYIDATEGQNFSFNDNDNWQTENYDIDNTLPGVSAQISVVMWWENILDGIYYENYTTQENYQFQVNVYWEENFQPVSDNHIDNYENWIATFYFENYESERIRLTSGSFMVYSEFEPQTLRIWDSDNNYFRTYRTVYENIDVYMVADNTAANLYFYTITLDDPTGQYGPPDGYVIIYTFEGGTPVFINDSYWAGTNTITAYLVFGTQYNLRLGADDISDLDWGTFDADANTSQTITPISSGISLGATPHVITAYVTWSFTWSDNETLVITYADSSSQTNWVAIRILDSRGDQVWFDNNASSSFSAQWTEGDNDNFYSIVLNIDHESSGFVSLSEYTTGLWGSVSLPSLSGSPPYLNQLGDPPVPWGVMLIAGLFTVIVMSFGPGSIGVGGVLVGAIGLFLNFMGLTAIDNEVLAMIIFLGVLIQIYESRKGGY